MSSAEDFVIAMNNQSASNSAFNAEQAAINRDWQTAMSNTAHQREVADLQNAGLNPILSANNGASVSSGSAASADTSATSGYAQLAATAMNNAASITMANISSAAQTAAASMAAAATMSAAASSAAASRYAADTAYSSAVDSARINNRNSKYGSIWTVLDGLTDFGTLFPDIAAGSIH